MRPISLSIAGLHSFRTKQTVDFQALCAGGVFGIFGPTGSGKSSLLDAMTLALFGKVERASNNTQGIMNHAENEIQVSFTFDLGQGEKAERYCVERSYKRTGDITIRSAACRLVQIKQQSQETIVLADKMNEIQEKLYELIGLTIDDFTRAVVLPQGKFAEFLSLKGVERRQMLQRLFHLEKYGDQLNEKLKQRVLHLRNRLSELNAEQQGLGEASTEALESLESKLKEIDQQLVALSAQRESFLTSFEEIKRWREWQQQLEQVELSLQEMLHQQEEMASLQSQLARAREALQIKPFVDEQTQALEAKREWTAKQELTAQECVMASAAAKQLEQVHTSKRKEKEEKQPLLVRRQHELKQAQALLEEYTAKEQEKTKLVVELEQLQTEYQSKQEELLQVEERLQRARTKQQQLKAQKEELNLDYSYKEELSNAYESLLKLEPLKEQVALAHAELVGQQQELAASKEANVKVKLEQQQIGTLARLMLREMEQIVSHIELLTRRAEEELQAGFQEQQEQNQRVEQLLEAEWIKKLTTSLHPGNPCPVCGSVEHPAPAGDHIEDVQALREQIDKQKQWLEEARVVNQSFQIQQQQVQDIQLQLAEWLEAELGSTDTKKKEVDIIQLEIPSETKELTVFLELAAGLSGQNLQTREQLLAAMVDIQKGIGPLVNQVRSFLQQGKAAAQVWREEMYKGQTALQNEQAVLKRKAAAEQKYEEWLHDWKKNYASFNIETTSAQYQELKLQEKAVSDLQHRIDKSVAFIEDEEKHFKQLEKEVGSHQIMIKEKSVLMRQLEGQLVKDHHKLVVLVQGEIAAISPLVLAEWLQQIEQEQLELMNEERKASEHWQQAQKRLSEANQAHAVAVESLQQSSRRAEQIQQRLEQMVVESSFSSYLEVVEAYVPKDEQLLWEKKISEYQSQLMHLQHEQKQLQNKLGSNRITEAEWEKWCERKLEIEESYDRVKEERGAAQHEWQAMQAKHARYMKLETEKDRLEQEQEKLGKLQAVFRGNSFVEFMAEEQLIQVCYDASSRLGQLTNQRYALEVDSQGGFVIRDDANGGVRRPVSTLSGGETFLTSLSLALALSAQIQLRGQYPLEFFFLDEGFGTLDPMLLDAVVTSLENLHEQRLAVGVISHVPELRERLPRKLIVTPAEALGTGSTVHLETL